jgi:hypothetical protein
MPSFAERLRMQSIFGGGNSFTPRDAGPLPLLDQMIKRLPREETPIQTIAQNLEPERQPRQVFTQAISPYQQALLDIRGKELESRERVAGEREETRRGQLDINRQRADIADWKAKNPGSKLSLGKDGVLRAFNPVTNEITELGKTGLSQTEIADLNQEKALERISATGEKEIATERERQKGRETLADINARHRKELEEFKSGQPPKGAGLPSQRKNLVELNYNILINRRPDLAKFVTRDDVTGEIKLKPEGATQGQIDEINSFIFGPGKEVQKGDINLPPEGKKEETPEERMKRLKAAAGVK